VNKGLTRLALKSIGGAVLFVACSSPAASQPQAPQPAPPSAAADYKDIAYEIEGRPVTLVNGVSEAQAAPGSASKIVTRYLGNEATGDLDGDGALDIAFLLTQSRGGSGTFYYVVVALRTTNGYSGTNAVLLGDRIVPQTTLINGSELIVTFSDRKAGDPMTTSPSVAVSKYFKVVGGKLVLR